ncbi:MAG: LPS export ABC transporter periplasmic protein LptC [Nitrospirota bacterium]
MENLYLKHKEGDTIKWELSSDKAVLPLGNKEVFLESLVLKINQTPEIYLTSGSGIYELEQGNISLNKPVELKIRDAVFATDSLKWNSKEELITSNDRIQLSGGSFLITGTGLSAKVQEQQVRITKDVKAIFYR